MIQGRRLVPTSATTQFSFYATGCNASIVKSGGDNIPYLRVQASDGNESRSQFAGPSFSQMAPNGFHLDYMRIYSAQISLIKGSELAALYLCTFHANAPVGYCTTYLHFVSSCTHKFYM